jgi:outer membrane protein assembly factor BamD
MPLTMKRFTAPALAGLLVLAACHRATSAGPSTLAPEVRYEQAMRDFRAGRFTRAQSAFQSLQFDLPPRDTLQARLRFYLAETYAGNDEMLLAAREFRRVADDFPSDALAAFALLRVGDQYSRMWRRAELDPTHGETALATYRELIGRYADTPAAQRAEVRVRTLQDQFARKDYENGVFYQKRGAFDSAILYFTGMIAKYPSSTLVPDAFVKLVQAYRAIGYREELEEKCAHLRQYFGTREDVRRECPATTATNGNGAAGR